MRCGKVRPTLYYLFLGVRVGGKLRTDLDIPVMKINTENDVLLLREGVARQDDSDRLRTWEIAGRRAPCRRPLRASSSTR